MTADYVQRKKRTRSLKMPSRSWNAHYGVGDSNAGDWLACAVDDGALAGMDTDGVSNADGVVIDSTLALELAGLAGGPLARHWESAIPIRTTAAARIAAPTCKSRVRR